MGLAALDPPYTYTENGSALALPCLPLWLTDELAIPLDLEDSYEKVCSDLRIA